MDPQETSALVPVTESAAALAAEVVIQGDLRKLKPEQKLTYVIEVCRSLGLNPLTRPFELIVLNNREVLYATRACTDQLRKIRGITITTLDPRQIGELYVVVATGRDRTGREDSATGAVPIVNLHGENLANAMMKAETKAKRRLTLSLSGLGWTDESEVEAIADAPDEVRKAPSSLAEKVAKRAAEVKGETPTEATVQPAETVAADAEPIIEGVVVEVEELGKAKTFGELHPCKLHARAMVQDEKHGWYCPDCKPPVR